MGAVIRLVAGGDVNVQGRDDPSRAFDGVASVLGPADIRFVNLEGPLSGTPRSPLEPDIPHKPNWQHSDPAMVDALTAAGIDVVSCANNVTFPPAAALASLAVLDDAGIAHCGAGNDLDSAHRAAVVTRGGVRTAFLAYTSICWPFGHAAAADTAGVAAMRATTSYAPDYRVAEVPGRAPRVVTTPVPHDLDRLIKDIRAARQAHQHVVVSVHWGIAGDELTDYQVAVGRAAISAGADIILGHGPHTIQAVEVFEGRPIFYSLGNLVFDWAVMRGRHTNGILVDHQLGGEALTRMVPVHRRPDNTVHLLTGADADDVLRRLERLSALRGTILVVDNGVGTLRPAPNSV